jgi:hypothetical protein
VSRSIHETLPGVYGGRLLVTYWDGYSRIDLYAYETVEGFADWFEADWVRRPEEVIAAGCNRAPNAPLLHPTILDAVAWEAARRLDPSKEAAPLSSDTLAALQRLSFTAWADQLAAESSG